MALYYVHLSTHKASGFQQYQYISKKKPRFSIEMIMKITKACWFIYKIEHIYLFNRFIYKIQKVREIFHHIVSLLRRTFTLHQSLNKIFNTELKEPDIQITTKYFPNFVNSIQLETEKYIKLILDVQLNDI